LRDFKSAKNWRYVGVFNIVRVDIPERNKRKVYNLTARAVP
jgi:hypothetical protein